MCQFTSVGARVDVPAKDFGLAATLGPKYGLCMAALLLHQYESNCPKSFVDDTTTPSATLTFCGHKKVTAKGLNPHIIKEIENEQKSLAEAQTFLQTMFVNYKTGQTGTKVEKNANKIVCARTALFSSTGNKLLRLGHKLLEQTKWHKQMVRTFGPKERAGVIQEMNMREEYGKIEKKYRDDLSATGVFDEKGFPAPTYFTPKPEKSASAPAPLQTPESDEKIAVGGAFTESDEKIGVGGAFTGANAQSARAPGRKLAESELLRRLGISGFLQMVGLRANATLGVILEASCLGPAGAAAAEATGPADSAPEAAAEGVSSEPANKKPRRSNARPVDETQARTLAGVALEEAGNQVYLIELQEDGFWAHVRVEGLVTVPGAAEKTRETFLVAVRPDDLIPPTIVVNDGAPQVVKPPQWREIDAATQDLGLYEIGDNVANKFLEAVANYAACALHLMTADASLNVRVYQMSEERKPLILQARSARQFAKGMLTLYPIGQILPPLSRTPEMLVESKNAAQNVDPSHLDRSWMEVRLGMHAEARKGKGRARQAGGADAEERTFTIQSPLLKKQLANLSPFWAVSKCSKGNKDHNMELVEIDIQVLLPKTPQLGGNLVKSLRPSAGSPSVTAKVVAMTNSKPVAENEILSLPFYSEPDR